MKFQTEINRLDYDCKRLKEQNDSKNNEIEELQNKNRQMYAQLQEEYSQH